MSHSFLFLKGASDPRYRDLLDLRHREHLAVAQERLNEQQRVHSKRIASADIDRRILTGDIWKSAPVEEERRVTLSTGQTLVNLCSGCSSECRNCATHLSIVSWSNRPVSPS